MPKTLTDDELQPAFCSCGSKFSGSLFWRINGMNDFFGNLREKFRQWSAGRYGSDELSKFLLIVTIACLIISFFRGLWAPLGFFSYVAIFAIVFSLLRTFSRNKAARYKEREIYIRAREKTKSFFRLQKRKYNERNTHVFYKCPHCKTTIRVPKGRGRIQITCPKCKTSFIKTT